MARPPKPKADTRSMMAGLAAKLAGVQAQKPKFAKLRKSAKRPKAKAKAKPTLVVDNTVPPAKKVRIGEIALARSRQRIRRRLDDRPAAPNPFKLPQFPPDAVPTGMAMDEAMPGLGWAASAWVASAFWEGQAFLGYPYLAELSQRPEHRRMVERVATEATRKWIRMAVATSGPPQEDGTPPKPDATLKGVDADKTAKLKQLEDAMKRLQVQAAFREMSEHDGYFGRGHIYLDTGDTDLPNELKTPIGDGCSAISTSKVNREKPLLRLKTVEPMWCYPTAYNSNNPLAPDWYRPGSWFVMGKEVHASRLLTFVSREVPDALKPAYAFGGLPLTQMAKPYVDNWLRTRQSVSDLISSFATMIFKTDMGATMGGAGDMGELFMRMDFFNQLRDLRGLVAIDKATEEVENVMTPLGTLDALQAQSQEHMASVSGIPIVILLGIQPMGLNASSEGEIRVFYDLIGAYQRAFFGDKLTTVINFVQLSLWGEVDPDITYEFVDLWSMNAKEQAEVRKLNAETDQILIDSGSLHPEESRKRVAADPDSPHASIDVEDVPEPPEEPDPGEGGAFGPFGSPKKMNGAGAGATDEGIGPFVLEKRSGQDVTFIVGDAEFIEAEHPRDDDGKFGSGGGGGEPQQEQAGQETPGKAPSGSPSGGLSKREERAVFAYQAGGSDIINAFVSGKDISDQYIPSHLSGIKEVPKATSDLRAAIDRSVLTVETPLFRGFSDTKGVFGDDTMIGKSFAPTTFFSTSKDERVAQSRGVIAWMRDHGSEESDPDFETRAEKEAWTMQVNAPAGTNALDFNQSLSRKSFENEQEVIMAPGIQVRIESIDRNSRKVIATVVANPIPIDRTTAVRRAKKAKTTDGSAKA